jgi:hypothetical protein
VTSRRSRLRAARTERYLEGEEAIPFKGQILRFRKVSSATCSCFDTSARAVSTVRPEVSKGEPKPKDSFLNRYKLDIHPNIQFVIPTSFWRGSSLFNDFGFPPEACGNDARSFVMRDDHLLPVALFWRGR